MLIEPRRFWRPCSQCCNSVKGFMVQHWSHESGRIVSDVPLFQTLSGSLRFLWSILMKYKGNLFMKSAVALLKHWRTHMSVALFIYIYTTTFIVTNINVVFWTLDQRFNKAKVLFFFVFFSHNYHKIFSVKRKYPVKPFPEGKKAPPVLFLLELVQFYLPWDTELIVREQSFLVQVREDQRELKKEKKKKYSRYAECPRKVV